MSNRLSPKQLGDIMQEVYDEGGYKSVAGIEAAAFKADYFYRIIDKVTAKTAEIVRADTLEKVMGLVHFIKAGHPEPETAAGTPYEPTYLMIDVKDFDALKKGEM